jgi:hypothetical protein
MAKVKSIAEHKSRGIVTMLKDLLQRAERGDFRAFAFVYMPRGPDSHVIGAEGDYWDHPNHWVAAAGRMQYKANQFVSACDGSPDTESMPL